MAFACHVFPFLGLTVRTSSGNWSLSTKQFFLGSDHPNLYFCRDADAQSSNVEVDWGVWIGNELSLSWEICQPLHSARALGETESLTIGREKWVSSQLTNGTNKKSLGTAGAEPEG